MRTIRRKINIQEITQHQAGMENLRNFLSQRKGTIAVLTLLTASILWRKYQEKKRSNKKKGQNSQQATQNAKKQVLSVIKNNPDKVKKIPKNQLKAVIQKIKRD